MERLTNKAWANLDPWECCGQDNYCKRGCHEEGGCNNGCIVPRLYRRLAMYEDTGLAPAEYLMRKDEIRVLEMFKEQSSDAEEAIKIAEARRENRLVILPCKVGDTVYAIMKGKVLAVYVVSIARHEWQPCWTVNLLFDHRKTNGVYAYSIDRFGRDVFLTREEAEAALKGEANGKDA